MRFFFAEADHSRLITQLFRSTRRGRLRLRDSVTVTQRDYDGKSRVMKREKSSKSDKNHFFWLHWPQATQSPIPVQFLTAFALNLVVTIGWTSETLLPPFVATSTGAASRGIVVPSAPAAPSHSPFQT